MSVKIAVVIPTRNRASFAINAAHSLLDQDVDIFISDNSTDPAELTAFARTEKRVHYLRPPSTELSMPEHWDWAVRQAMERSQATHFNVHYDRKFSKAGIWREIVSAVSERAETLLTFPIDFISRHPAPLRLWQTPWTGKKFTIQTARVAKLITEGKVPFIGHAIPVLSNCVVPREVLSTIVKRFGSVCSSTAPDTAFMARFLALNDHYIHMDKAPGVLYGSERSNALGYMRGKGGDFADYQKTWGNRPWLEAAPIPGLNLGSNMLFHEYELVRRETGERLPPLDRAGVLEDLGTELRWVEDEQLKEELRQLLRSHGWNSQTPPLQRGQSWQSYLFQRICLARMRWFGATMETITSFSFRNDETALRYALRYPRARQESAGHLDLLEPVEAGSG
jgi:hypothetical protein